MAEFQINFRWVSSNSARTASTEQIKQGLNQFARVLVRDVAIRASDHARASAAAQLRRSVRKDIDAELSRMSKAIARSISQPDDEKGPRGEMSILSNTFGARYDTGVSFSPFASQLSETAQRTWGTSFNFDARQSGIKWDPRSRNYMRRRKQTGRWFRQSGDLESFLSNLDGRAYEGFFGPVRVSFSPTRQATAPTTPTETGRRSSLSATIRVGDVRVQMFGKITPRMMSGLTSMNPVGSKPLGGGPGVAALIDGALPGDKNVRKLMQKSFSRSVRKRVKQADPTGKRKRAKWAMETMQTGGNYRPAIDPFVAFYMMRAVPNAIWRRLERSVVDRSDTGSAGRSTNL